MIRNRVKRRLRAITREHLGTLPEGVTVVVRALPDAAEASFDSLVSDLSGAMRQAYAKAAR